MSDFISLMELIMGRDDVGCFNVSTGAGHSIAEIFHLVAAHLGKPDVQPASVVEPGADDVSAVVLDPSHTEQTFDWKATRNFEQTITDMLLWYDAHGITDVYSHLQGRS
jgi:UDP-glucose 4-epimerase